MANKIVLEVVAFTYNGCVNAVKGGADRIELCDNQLEGGTTPSYGMIKQIRENLDIQIYPLIRPRAGNFLYSEQEFQAMLDDIEVCKQLKCDGIAVGVQNNDGTIDADRMKRIVEKAYPMGVTSNRVFDFTPDPFKALDILIDAGCERVLTSGQRNTAVEAMDLLAKLVQYAGDKIIIMPGSGVRPDNIERIVKTVKAKEYHSSARKYIPGQISYQNPNLQDLGNIIDVDMQQLIDIRRIAESVL